MGGNVGLVYCRHKFKSNIGYIRIYRYFKLEITAENWSKKNSSQEGKPQGASLQELSSRDHRFRCQWHWSYLFSES